jgi:hypothetical protein
LVRVARAFASRTIRIARVAIPYWHAKRRQFGIVDERAMLDGNTPTKKNVH